MSHHPSKLTFNLFWWKCIAEVSSSSKQGRVGFSCGLPLHCLVCLLSCLSLVLFDPRDYLSIKCFHPSFLSICHSSSRGVLRLGGVKAERQGENKLLLHLVCTLCVCLYLCWPSRKLGCVFPCCFIYPLTPTLSLNINPVPSLCWYIKAQVTLNWPHVCTMT